ncbi:MAG: tetratricopeptide repeat protein [Phycisphaerales bacterium]|nr:tetratricopeptide repeat protein [Phycisphaerales bacterium]
MVPKRWINSLAAAVVAAGMGGALYGAQATERIDSLLRQEKWDEVLQSPELSAALKSEDASQAAMARYQLGVAKFMRRDLLGAGRELAKLSPFDQPYGGHAQYLLARVHDLMNERPEAAADYRGVAAWWEKHGSGGGGSDPALRGGEMPEYVIRAIFYNGVILGEQEAEKIPEAIEQLRKFTGLAKSGSSQVVEATLRIGLLQLKAKQFNEAIETLRPIREDARFGDQALWFTARAVLAAAPPSAPSSPPSAGGSPAPPSAPGSAGGSPEAGLRESQIKRAIGKLEQAAEKAGALALNSKFEIRNSNQIPNSNDQMDARLRRADELLELGDAQMMLKQFAEASATYGKVFREATEATIGGEEISQRAQQAMARQAGAMELAGRYDECEKLATEFEKRWPRSVLLGGVLFRGAESVYLQAMALSQEEARSQKPEARREADLEKAIQQLKRVVHDYPQLEQVSAARHAWGCILYHLERYTDAADVLRGIPEAERTGPLATASLMLGDCLLRTVSRDDDDALSTGRMLMQVERALAQFSAFIAANPHHPEAPQAYFKLGYCYQVLVASKLEGSRWDSLNKAQDCYNKLLEMVKPEDPLAAAAVLERAKVLQLRYDTGGAERELKRFQTDPLAKSDCHALAIYKLGSLWRMMGRPAEGADLMGKLLTQLAPGSAGGSGGTSGRTQMKPPAEPGADDSPLSRLVEYEYGLSLKDAGKREEAKKVFAHLAENPRLTQGINSLWRLAQIDREPLTSAIDAAKLKIHRARRPADADAARKELIAAADVMRKWLDGMQETLINLDRMGGRAYVDLGEEGRPRLWYEVAWGIRALEDATVELNEPFRPVHVGSIEVNSVRAFTRAAEVGAHGNAAARDAANIANMDLGETLAQRGKYDDAMDAFAGILYNGGNNGWGGIGPQQVGRAKLRIAQCLLSKGDPQNAIRQAENISRSAGSYVGQGRYVIGEAYLQMNDFKRATDTLRAFQDDRNYLASREVADKALLRLGEALEQRRYRDEAVLVYEMLLKKFPRSPVADEARARLIATKYAWAGIMSRPRSAM